jgi:hypothetical protein
MPIVKPTVPANGGPPTANAIPPAIQKLNIPQAWKQRAATDTAYASYLTGHAPDEDEE